MAPKITNENKEQPFILLLPPHVKHQDTTTWHMVNTQRSSTSINEVGHLCRLHQRLYKDSLQKSKSDSTGTRPVSKDSAGGDYTELWSVRLTALGAWRERYEAQHLPV